MRLSSVQEIESALTRLSIEDLRAVRDWLDDFIEDQLEVSQEFKTQVRRAQQALAEGVYSRTRQPEIASCAPRCRFTPGTSTLTSFDCPQRSKRGFKLPLTDWGWPWTATRLTA